MVKQHLSDWTGVFSQSCENQLFVGVARQSVCDMLLSTSHPPLVTLQIELTHCQPCSANFLTSLIYLPTATSLRSAEDVALAGFSQPFGLQRSTAQSHQPSSDGRSVASRCTSRKAHQPQCSWKRIGRAWRASQRRCSWSSCSSCRHHDSKVVVPHQYRQLFRAHDFYNACQW